MLTSSFPGLQLPAELLRKLVYFESQYAELINDRLIPNLYLGKRTTDAHDLSSLFQQLNIDNLANRIINNQNISGGQLKRIAFARSIVHSRPIIILDEPTSGLDKMNELILLNQITKLSQNAFLLVITHSKLLQSHALHSFHLGQ